MLATYMLSYIRSNLEVSTEFLGIEACSLHRHINIITLSNENTNCCAARFVSLHRREWHSTLNGPLGNCLQQFNFWFKYIFHFQILISSRCCRPIEFISYILYICWIYPTITLKFTRMRIFGLYIFIVGITILNLVGVIFKTLRYNLHIVFLHHIITLIRVIIITIFLYCIITLIEVIVH